VFSSLPNVSALGHFGGLAAGAAAALLLNVERFGRAGWRWLALVPLAALPWAAFETLQWQRANAPLWQTAEDIVFHLDWEAKVHDANRAYREATKADPDLSAEKRLVLVRQARELYEALDAAMARTSYRSPDVIQMRDEAREEIARAVALLKAKEDQLREPAEKAAERNAAAEREREKDVAQRDKEQTAFNRTFRQRIVDTTDAAEKLLGGKADPATEEASLKEQRAALDGLVADLNAGGAFRSEAVERQRKLGLDYAAALARLLALSEERRKAGDAWTEEQEARWKRQQVTAEQRRSEWLDRDRKK
jgi:hypothetical protein